MGGSYGGPPTAVTDPRPLHAIPLSVILSQNLLAVVYTSLGVPPGLHPKTVMARALKR